MTWQDVEGHVGTDLWADMSRDAGKLWVRGESCQVIHSFNQRSSCGLAFLSVLLSKGSIQGLRKDMTVRCAGRMLTFQDFLLLITRWGRGFIWNTSHKMQHVCKADEDCSKWATHCLQVHLGQLTFIDLTRLAVVLATSLADWTNCRLATALEVWEEARRQALHRADVCLATMVAAERTWPDRQKEWAPESRGSEEHCLWLQGQQWVPETGCRLDPPGSGRPSEWTD